MNDNERFWVLDVPKDIDTSKDNRIHEVAAAAAIPGDGPVNVVGIVDEKHGGVLAWVYAAHADDIVATLNDSENGIPPDLRLSFEPEAILEHFEAEPAVFEKLKAAAEANPKKMREECANCLHADPLYTEFHRQCAEVFTAMTGEDYYT